MKNLFQRKNDEPVESEALPMFNKAVETATQSIEQPVPTPEPVVPDKPSPERALNRIEAELLLGEQLRVLTEVELQLRSKKVSWKSKKTANGLVSEFDLISHAEYVKNEINKLSSYLLKLGMTKPEIQHASDVAREGVKTYEFWLVTKPPGRK